MSERKLRKAAVITAVFILILFLIPVKINYNDGGTVQYKAALYTVVKWNCYVEPEEYIMKAQRIIRIKNIKTPRFICFPAA